MIINNFRTINTRNNTCNCSKQKINPAVQNQHSDKINFCYSRNTSFLPIHLGLADNDVCHTTHFWRCDINWTDTAERIIRHFEGLEQIPVFNHACSQGDESYTLLIELAIKLGGLDQARQRFPITATDIAEKQINRAKNGLTELTIEEITQLKEKLPKLGLSFENCFYTERKKNKGQGPFPYKITDVLKKYIIFKQSDIRTFAETKQNTPCVVTFRYGWRFLSQRDQCKLVQNLYKNLPPGSLFIIGDDIGKGQEGYWFTGEKGIRWNGWDDIHDLLAQAGFKPVEDILTLRTQKHFIYERPEDLILANNGL